MSEAQHYRWVPTSNPRISHIPFGKDVRPTMRQIYAQIESGELVNQIENDPARKTL